MALGEIRRQQSTSDNSKQAAHGCRMTWSSVIAIAAPAVVMQQEIMLLSRLQHDLTYDNQWQ